MKQLILFAVALVFNIAASAQEVEDKGWTKVYRESAPRVNDLVHTKVEVKFDYEKSYLYGKVWLTLKPHFYATDSLKLDAKAMEIKNVSLVKGSSNEPLKYKYDGMELNIDLNKSYSRNDKYTIFIDYVSKPNEYKARGSAAITDAKGLYFINPKGEDKNKPTQIWTQGETEGTSVWVPIIDKPNQKTTDEIIMTVPAKYVTLSNGKLASQKKNADGTRTDHWKMDLPHAPYLFFMGVGDFAIVKDDYKGKEVSYYVEKEYAPVARKIFGGTPEMITFFSKVLGVEYPWVKYSQIVGRDYVSGAMENTTATLHQESAQQDARELIDGNVWENTISHELFHQWFGDYVTSESWSNLTLNESFANYSEYLWLEYKYGKETADEQNFGEMNGYLQSPSDKKDLVRFFYDDKESMFDAVSYNKGGRILHMLRNYVGDSAFYRALNNYLNNNKFGTGEAHQLRIEFEKVTGKDLNWFWNQWYYGSGHPVVKINYVYDDSAKRAMVIITQTQQGDKVFKLPIAIDVYNGADKKRYHVWMNNKTDTFSFSYTQRPVLLNVDGDKILLWQKTENKTAENYIAQMKYAPLYLDRREALAYFAKNKMPELLLGLKDKFAGLRSYTLEQIEDVSTLMNEASTLQTIENMVKTDSDRKVRAKALEVLANTGDAKYKPLFEQYVNDSSYSISGAALEGLNNLDSANAFALAKKLSTDAKGKLGEVIAGMMMSKGSEADFDFIENRYEEITDPQDKFDATEAFCSYLTKVNDPAKLKKGIDKVVAFRNMIPESIRGFTDPIIKEALENVAKTKGSEIEQYVGHVLK